MRSVAGRSRSARPVAGQVRGSDCLKAGGVSTSACGSRGKSAEHIKESARANSGRRARVSRRLLAGAILLATAVALVGNTLWIQHLDCLDMRVFRCYAEAFWHGAAILHQASTSACSAYLSGPPQQFRSFPPEYPPASLLVMTIPLLLPWIPYTAAFTALMAAFVATAVSILVVKGHLGRAACFAVYTLLAGWSFTLERFDLLVGLLVLLALVAANRGHLRIAAAVLAAGALLKLFPIALLPILLLASRRGDNPRWRWDVIAVFGAVCVAGLLPQLVLSPSSVTSPVHYEMARPLQIESLPGMLLWSTSGVTQGTNALSYANGGPYAMFSYNSFNVGGGAQLLWGSLATLAGLFFLTVAYLRAWLGQDSLGRSFVLVLLVVLMSGKVFSPQYVLWLLPTVALVEGMRLRWLVLSGLIYLIYYYYNTITVGVPFDQVFVSTVTIRNAFLVGIVLVYAFLPGDLATTAWPTRPLLHYLKD